MRERLKPIEELFEGAETALEKIDAVLHCLDPAFPEKALYGFDFYLAHMVCLRALAKEIEDSKPAKAP